MHRTNIYLTEQQERALDAVARAEGITRSEAIRTILDRHLSAADASDLEAALIASRAEVHDALDRLFTDDDDLAIR